jgi:hypothetical protein
MKASAANPINTGNNTPAAGNSFNGGSSNPIPGGGINPFAGDGGDQLQKLIFDRLKLVLGNDFSNKADSPFTGGGNPFAGSTSSIPGVGKNPFAGSGGSIKSVGSNPIAGAGSLLQQSPFDPLKEVLGNNMTYTGGSSSLYNASNAPVGQGNRDFGSKNATIGNGNSDYGDDSATIGNGNWNFNSNNATIGNGNWLFGSGNTNLGNGNWYWDNGSNNATLGNGNWHFGSENATIGNGNWDFGNNNTIIGNGNWIFTSGNTVVGNGNWLVGDKNISSLESLPLGSKGDVESLINSLVSRIGKDFTVLTGDFGASETETFNRLILSKGAGIDFSNTSFDIHQLLAALSKNQGNMYQPVQNSQSVPEPSSVPLIVIGILCLLMSRLKKGFRSSCVVKTGEAKQM